MEGDQVVVIKGQEGRQGTSMKMHEDPFAGLYGDSILEPPYSLEWLSHMPDNSNILGQCIEAMETNIDGFGFMLEPLVDDVTRSEVEAERRRIENFFDFINPDIPYSQLRRRARRDMETTGNAYWEVIRDGKGGIVWIEHIEAYTMRLTALEKEQVEVTTKILDDAKNEYSEYPCQKRFRRYAQIRSGKKVYFKEFGDPRDISSVTGLSDGGGPSATEVIHFKLYSPHSPYGVPRWIGNALAVMGSRQAEEVNYEYFENNTVPPLALLVSGSLSDKSVERIEGFISDNMKGRKGFHKILVVQAAPFSQPVPGVPSEKVSLQFQPLSDAQQKDALFDNYDRTNREKIRSSFRLPPIYVGVTEDYTRATAHESRCVAEEQVFGPERGDHDFVINRKLFPDMDIRYWRYKSTTPDTNDVDMMSQALDIFVRAGITVGESRNLMGRLLGEQLETPEEYADMPVTAYLQSMSMDSGGDTAGAGEPAVKNFVAELVKIRKGLAEADDDAPCSP